MTAFPDLTRFFTPRAIALVGIPSDLSKFGGRVLDQFLKFRSISRVYLVNPRYTELHGMQCYPDLRSLPEVPDLAVLLVAAQAVPAALEDVAAAGIAHALAFPAGFAESGTPQGTAAQQWITDFSRRTGVRVMGPNCNGFVNFTDGIALCPGTIEIGKRKAGSIGILSHSGGLAQVNVMWQAQELGLGVSHLIMCGNDADLDLLDLMHFLVEDPATRVVLVIGERIADGPRFFAVTQRALELDKPIVMIKAGRTEAGRVAAASHTGAVTGSDAVHDAAMRQAGVTRVYDCGELYETGMLLATGKRPGGAGAVGLSISGGSVVLMSDLGAAEGLTWPAFAESTQARLAPLMPSFGKVKNPIDLTGAIYANTRMFSDAFTAVASDPGVDIVISAMTHATLADFDSVVDAGAQSDKLVAVVLSGTCREDPTRGLSWLVEAGIPAYRNLLPCMKALRNAVGYAAFRRRKLLRPHPTRPEGIDIEAARELLQAGVGTLSERASKDVLAAYGFPVAGEALATSPFEAVKIAARLNRPLALKIESPDLPHKTEANAIRLNVSGTAAVQEAYAAVVAGALAYRPDAHITGVLVQVMAPKGLEVILGVSRDPVFGPVVTLGLGGVQVEVLGDVAHRIAPIDHAEAAAMLDELKGRKLFDAWRATPARDLACLTDLIVRTSWLAADCADLIEELDINPIVLLEEGKGAMVVDALIVRRQDAETSTVSL